MEEGRQQSGYHHRLQGAEPKSPVTRRDATCDTTRLGRHTNSYFTTIMTSTNDIVNLLGATLSPDTNTRISAELQLSQTLSHPGLS
jgi:hypothetical protein